MPKLVTKNTLPYSSKKIYNLVMDIEQYPKFLPWCRQAQIIEVISAQNLHADLLINFKNFFEKYRSNVTHGIDNNGNYFVDVIAIEGPFKKLVNKWQFIEIDHDKCQVEFFLEFEFNSKLLSKLIGPIFGKASSKMMSAFEQRAKEIY